MSAWLSEVSRRVVEGPERVAIRAGAESLTYEQLAHRSNQLAHCLAERGVAAAEIVGVHLPRGLDLPVAMLAVLKASCAYLPLDPELPPLRLGQMLEQARPAAVITTKAGRAALPSFGGAVLRLDEEREEIAAFEARPLLRACPPSSAAYVVFTSGTSGTPKGVLVSHASLSSYLQAMAERPGLSSEDKCLALATIAFDMSVLDFWLPLGVGAELVLADGDIEHEVDRLRAQLDEGEITFLHATPSMLCSLVEQGWVGGPHLRVLCGGEVLTREVADAVSRRCRELYNAYGPAEATVCSTLWQVEPQVAVSIGTPIPRCSVYVLSESGARVPPGTAGELWIGGAGVAIGYVGEQELTREVFQPDPFSAEPGARMYRSGDLALEGEGGLLYFLGRADDQVKIRGHRVELSEVEAVLARCEGAGAVAVVCIHGAQAPEARLAAYYTAEPGALPPRRLLEFAAERLPQYMVPRTAQLVEALPRLASGKLDRRALPEPVPVSRVGSGPSLLPEARLDSDVERTVAAAFSEVLGVQRVLASSNFFELGGSSLLAARLKRDLEARLGEEVALGTIFEGRTVRGVAQRLLAGGGAGESPRVLSLRPEGTRNPVYCVLGLHYFQDLADALADIDRPWYGAYVPVEQSFFDRATTVAERGALLVELGERYHEAIVKRQPRGACCLVGHATGGIIAFEVARRMVAAGHPVERVVLLDTVLSTGVSLSPRHHLKKGLMGLRRGAERRGLEWSGQRLERIAKVVPLPSRAKHFAEMSLTQSQALRHVRMYEMAEDDWLEGCAEPYEGDLVFVHALRRDAPVGDVSHDAGWRRLVKGRFDVLEVDCTHDEMVRQPSVSQLAEALRPLLA